MRTFKINQVYIMVMPYHLKFGSDNDQITLFTPLRVGGAAHTARFFGQLKHTYKKIIQKHYVFQCFYNVFRRKHRNLRGFRIKSVQNTGYCSVFKALASKKFHFPDLLKPLKTPLFTLFYSIFPCANAAGQLKHIYEKSFKNIDFFQCFYICSVKNAVIYTFFALKSV